MAAGTLSFLFAVALTWRLASSQLLGPGNCLISRLDVINCTRNRPGRTALPNANEYGIYNTKFRPGPAGLPVCGIRNPRHVVRPIDTIGDTDPVMIIFSPGFTLEPKEMYGNQQLVNYSIQCPEGRLAFLNVTDLDMEGRVCEDNLGVQRCVDYVLVDRGEFGVTESCGNDPSANNDQLEFGSLQIILRTSERSRFPGFRASIICFDPEMADMPGCTRPQGDNSTMSTPSPGSPPMENRRRKKRDLEMFEDRWRRHAAHIKRMRRQADLSEDYPMLRFMELNVAHGVNVTYSKNTLQFVNESGPGDMIKDIIFLHTFDANGVVDEFKENAVVERGGEEVPIPFPGPGPMIIVGTHAYFTLFVIDPRGLVPNAEEMLVLANLTEAQFSLAQENETERLPIEVLEPTVDPPESLGLPPLPMRRRRQAPPSAPTIEDQAVLVALQNGNACNPVLRASANAIIEEVQRTDPERLQMLRETLLMPPPPDNFPPDDLPADN